MVIMEPEEDPLAVSSFFWFLPYSEVKDPDIPRQRVFSFEQRFVRRTSGALLSGTTPTKQQGFEHNQTTWS